MKLFESHSIGELKIKNRIAMAPMAIGGLVEPDGRFSEQAISYYRERARGGAGLIITGITTADTTVERNLLNGWAAAFPRLDSGAYVPRLSKLVDAVHDYGAKLAVQLTAGFGRVAPRFLMRAMQPIAPSAVPCFWDSRTTAREMKIDEIEKLIKSLTTGARIAAAAGVDAIELHGHEGYLFDQFKTELWNKRQDKYGGNLIKRLRFTKEVIESIKTALGEKFPIIYRYGLTHYLEGGREVDEGLEIARHLESFGADALHVDAGAYETWYWAHPPLYMDQGCMVDMAAAVKKVVKIPVIAVGRLGSPELAEQVLQEGKADFIALGRPLLADPEWPNKTREKRTDDIRPCIGDHDGCLGRTFKGKALSCAVNPQVGLEEELTLTPAQSPLSILVIGGGPAGMEAARVAALRGHSVTLYEKQDQLGGNLIPASVPSFKKDVKQLMHYFSIQLPKVGVDVRLGQEVTPGLVEKIKPDALIIATGARPIIPDIPGIEQENVMTAIDLLLHKKSGNKHQHITVAGGGFIGCETAAYLAEKGNNVTLVEALPQIIGDMFPANREYLLKMLMDHDVKIVTGKSLVEIEGPNVMLRGDKDDQESLKADMIVLSLGLESRLELKDALEGTIPRLFTIGDCVEPRRIFDAIWEAFRLARLI